MSKKEKEKNIEAEEAAEIQADSEKETAEESTCEKELADTKEQLLRITAEYANFRKRSEKEKQDTFVFAKSETIKELLPVIDNLERALANDKEDFDGLKKGVEMTFDSLIAILNKIGVEIFGTPGDEFNPNLHNAVMHIEDENLGENVITDVFQKGYRINDKVIRPAMVKTAN